MKFATILKGIRFIRGYRKGTKMEEKKSVLSGITTSRTTQNTAVGGTLAVGGGFSIFGLLTAVRSALPDILPWSQEADYGIAALATMLLNPLISRVIALRRNPEKKAVQEAFQVERPLSDENKAKVQAFLRTL